jgi:hypothetical protein
LWLVRLADTHFLYSLLLTSIDLCFAHHPKIPQGVHSTNVQPPNQSILQKQRKRKLPNNKPQVQQHPCSAQTPNTTAMPLRHHPYLLQRHAAAHPSAAIKLPFFFFEQHITSDKTK